MSHSDKIYEVYASSATKEKIAKEHSVSFEEVEEAFFNSSPPFPIDKRMKNQTKPPTRWFISETMDGRFLKVTFIVKKEKFRFEVKSAYEPDENDILQYIKEGGKNIMSINEEEKEKKEQLEIEQAIEGWKKSRPDILKKKKKPKKQDGTYIRFPTELRIALQILAAKKHMGYQTYLKMILADHVEDQIEDGKIDPNVIKKAIGD